MVTFTAMALVWSRLALAALVAGVAAASPAAAAGSAAARPTCCDEPGLACPAPAAPVLTCADRADADDAPVALVAVAPPLPTPPVAVDAPPTRLDGAAELAVDILPFAPKTSPPRT